MKVLFNGDFAARVRSLADGTAGDRAPQAVPAPVAAPASVPVPAPVSPSAPARSDAVALLAVLQREGRLVDFLKEPVAGYSDAQVGAVVRDIHRDCAAAVERIFAVQPVLAEAEGASVSVTSADAARVRVVGSVGASGSASGIVRHPGWQATRVDLPQWTGTSDGRNVIAPAEVEAK